MRHFFGLSFACVTALFASAVFAQELPDLAGAGEHQMSITDKLIAQGPIGIVCLILLFLTWRVYKDARDDKKDYEKKLDAKDERTTAIALEHAKDRAQATLLMERI